MRPKDMSYHSTAIFSKEYYAKNFGTKLAPKLVALKQMQLNADIKGLEARKLELTNILAKQWWDTTDLLTEKNQIDLLLQSPTTEAFSTIKNADLDTAVKTFNDIKNNLSEPELKAAQSILESRPDYASKSEINSTEQKLNENKSTSSHNTQIQNNTVNVQKTNNHIKPTYAFDNIVDFENDTMKLHKVSIQSNSTCAYSVTTNNSEKPSYNSAHYNYAYANTPPSSHVNTNDSYNTHDVCDNKMYASGYDKFTPTPMVTLVAAKIQNTQGNGNKSSEYNNKKIDSAQSFNGSDQSSRKRYDNPVVSSEFKTMQMNGDKKGLEIKKEQLEKALKNTWLPWNRSSIHAQIAEIDKILKSWGTETLSIIKDADIHTAREEFNRLEESAKWQGESYDSAFCVKQSENVTSLSDVYDAAQTIFYNRKDLAPNLPFHQDAPSLEKKDIINNSTVTNDQEIILNNEQDIIHIDSLDMVSTTINQDAITITPEVNQRIAETLDTLSDHGLEIVSNHIDTLVEMLQAQKLDTETRNTCFAVGLEAYTLLQKYIENPNKQIVAHEDTFNARKDALKSVAYNPTECYAQSHELTPKAYAALQSYRIDPDQFTYCLGNAVQQQFHNEVVTMLNEMAHIPSNTFTQPLRDMVITCTHAGNAYAQQNNMEKAFSLADCAWAALDCANIGVENGINLTQKTNIDRDIEIAKGIMHGVKNAVLNTTNMVLDPVGTISNVGNALSHFTLCLMDIASLTEDDFLTFNLDNSKYIEENAQIRREKIDAIIDAVNKTTLQGGTAFVTEQIVSCLIMDFGIGAIKHCAKSSAIPLAKLGKVITDKVPTKIPKAFSAIRQKITDALSNLTKAEHVAITADGVKVTVTNIAENVVEHGPSNKLISKMETQPNSQAVKNAAVITEEQVTIKSTQSLAELRQSVLSLEKRMLTNDELKKLGFRGDSFHNIDKVNLETGYIRINTESQGGMEKAQEIFNRVKKEFENRKLIPGDTKLIEKNGAQVQITSCRFEDGSCIQIRPEGKSGHIKVDIKDVLANTYEKITLK